MHYSISSFLNVTVVIAVIIIIISGSIALVRTLAASHRRFRNLIKTLGKTPLDE
jgi:hypothetical protein